MSLPQTAIAVNGRVVGYVRGDTFYRRLRGSIHLLRKPYAVAFDPSVLRDAKAAGATRVVVEDVETGARWEWPLSEVFLKAFTIERGYGPQLAIRIQKQNRLPELVQGALL